MSCPRNSSRLVIRLFEEEEIGLTIRHVILLGVQKKALNLHRSSENRAVLPARPSAQKGRLASRRLNILKKNIMRFIYESNFCYESPFEEQ